MTILSDQTIHKLCEGDAPLIAPFAERTRHEIGASYGLSFCGYDLRTAQEITMQPGDFRMISTIERLDIPNDIRGAACDKSTYARCGISVFNTRFEPGWRGYPTIEIVNNGRDPFYLPAGAPICQMEFAWLDLPSCGYEGKYQDQPASPVKAIWEVA